VDHLLFGVQANAKTMALGLPTLFAEHFPDQFWSSLHPKFVLDSTIRWRQTNLLRPVPDQLYYVQLLHFRSRFISTKLARQVQDKNDAAAGGEFPNRGLGATSLHQELPKCWFHSIPNHS